METSERMVGVRHSLCEKGAADNLSAGDKCTGFQHIFLLYARKNPLHMLKAIYFPLYLKGFVSPPTVCALDVSLCNPGQLHQICDSLASTSQNAITFVCYYIFFFFCNFFVFDNFICVYTKIWSF